MLVDLSDESVWVVETCLMTIDGGLRFAWELLKHGALSLPWF